jgi:hypothetical protein
MPSTCINAEVSAYLPTMYETERAKRCWSQPTSLGRGGHNPAHGQVQKGKLMSDDHLVVTLMYDQLDVLEELIDAHELGGTDWVSLERWIQDTRKMLPERGKRG